MHKGSGKEMVFPEGWPYLPLRLEQGNKLVYPLFDFIFTAMNHARAGTHDNRPPEAPETEDILASIFNAAGINGRSRTASGRAPPRR